MTKKEYLWRYILIIKKLRKHPATFEEINNYLKLESEIQAYHFNVSLRTFQRDVKDISSIFDIEIKCNRSIQQYYIDSEGREEAMERILEAFDTFNALNMTNSLSGFIHFEKRKPQGTENLHGMLHAITNKLQIEFTYHKFWEEEPTHRMLEPYALKEFQGRWYVVGLNLSDQQVKTFGLDRISEFVITGRKFSHPKQFNVNEHFRHCFGIISPIDQELQEVILSFNPFQGIYIRSLPLHESQEILTDNEKELRIRLRVYVTHDFFMEILSHGDSVKVIQPNNLIQDLKSSYRNALSQYPE